MSNISDDLKKVMLAGIGAAAVTAEKSKAVVDTLVEKGELTVAQGKVVNEELKRKAKDELNTVKEKVSEQAKTNDTQSLLDKVHDLTPEQRAALKAKLAELDEKKDE